MVIRVIVNGAAGKMGVLAVKTLSNHPDFTVVGALGKQDNLGAEISNTKAQVVIDLTNAEVVFKNAQTIIEAGAHPVIGTSGLIKDQITNLQNRCAQLKLGGIIAPNFSLGAVLMMRNAQEIAKYFPHVEIIEMHHDGKLDSPSATAVYTAEMISKTKENLSPTNKKFRETIPGSRGASYKDIPIHAIRLPGLIAHQQIIFGGIGETLTLRHDSIDRQCFMPGIVFACKKVGELKELIYGLEKIL